MRHRKTTEDQTGEHVEEAQYPTVCRPGEAQQTMQETCGSGTLLQQGAIEGS